MKRLLIIVGLVTATASVPLGAQGVRVSGTTLTQYFELQPVVEDSIPDSLTVGTGYLRQTASGTVGCPDGHTQCYFYRSAPMTHTVPFTQDVEATGWGLGEGVSIYAHIRAQTALAGETELWTRENEHFNALAAYVEIVRERWTARAGRQWLNSQLGVNNFDGASLALRWPWGRGLRVEGYVGRALVQGLSQPFTNSSLEAADVLPPDVGAVLLGADFRYHSASWLALSGEYQREMRDDRAGLYSERAALDAVATAGSTTIAGDMQADLASSAFNEVRIRVSHPLADNVSGGIQYLHSTPFFPLWTIWGVFAPLGFNEARADAQWAPADSRGTASLSGAYRQYQNTHTGVGFLPLLDYGWTITASGTWRALPTWNVHASYQQDIGFGASGSNGDAGVRWQRVDGSPWLGLIGSATQNMFEFRLASGYLVGASLDGGIPLTPDIRLAAQAGIYRQIAGDSPATTVNWNQRRAVVRLEWTAGRDPGMKP